jgi:hypothetical protein
MTGIPGLILLAATLVAAPLCAVEPSAADQAAMQAALSHYLRALNGCDLASAAQVSSKTFLFRPSGLPWGIRSWAALSPASCGPTRPPFEITGLARILNVVTPDVTVADGYFRAMNLPGGEKAGSLNAIFVREAEGAWKIAGLRLYAAALERPMLPVTPSAQHDPPGSDGWITLFDGQSKDSFLAVNGDPFPSSWKVEDGLLEAVRTTRPGMASHALRTRDTYKSFELRFSWKVAERGNSRIKYHLFYLNDFTVGSDAAGYEYQLADDQGDPGASKFPVERTGSLYNQIAAQDAQPKALGEFNESAIIVRGRHCEHWLNGVKVVEFESESNPPEGPIIIQHHQTGAAFRSMKIRRLD